MFGDKPTAYERLTDTLGDIGDRLTELEERLVERFDPRPSRAERARRAVMRHLPFTAEPPAGISRYVPDFLAGWHLPSKWSAAEARRHARSLRSDAEERLDDARGYLDDARSYISGLRLPRAASFQKGFKTRGAVDRLSDRPEVVGALVVGGAIAAVGVAYFVTKKIQEHSEEPDYEAVRQDGAIEIRDYDAMVIAETVKSGYHEKARRIGFETLANYIFAKNRSGKKIPMTVPVLQQLANGEGRTKGWAVRFVMPKKYSKASLPEPGSADVSLKDVPSRRVAAIRFSGNFNASLASRQLMALYNYLADNNLKQKGDPEYAFYNPPWTPGFMRRNEILIEIER